MTDAPANPQRPLRAITAAALAAAIAVALPMVKSEEGYRPVGYRDIIGVPSYCYGGTGPKAIVDKRYTAAECNSQVASDVRSHAEGIAACVRVPTPAPSLAAFISFSYNVGVAGFCRSSIARHLNAGDLKDACAGLSAYAYAGGKRIPGLAARRAKERALCERGLREKPTQ
jgi:lysozyme